MISAEVECLRLAHDNANFASNLALKELDAAHSSLLPLIPGDSDLFKLDNRGNLGSGILVFFGMFAFSFSFLAPH